jgi:hypothetical protein
MVEGETLQHEIPISTIRVPEKTRLREKRNRLGGSGHIKTGHLASKSRVMLTTPKVLARDTITSEIYVKVKHHDSRAYAAGDPAAGWTLPCIFGGCSIACVSPEYAAKPVQPLDPEAAVAQINAYRTKNGRKPVVLDERLCRAAASQSKAQAGRSRIGHDLEGYTDRVDAAMRPSRKQAGSPRFLRQCAHALRRQS